MTGELANVTAAILAGGLGTRLRPVIDDRPKVLAPVSGRPFLTYFLDALQSASVRRVVLLTGYRGEQVRQALGERYGDMTLAYSDEPVPRGTGGALCEALPYLGSGTILLLNGDSYCEVGLAGFVRFHRRRRASLSLLLASVDDVSRYGQVATAPDGRITAFAEKQQGGPGWINAGMYLIERELLEEVSPGGPISLERELLPNWVKRQVAYGYRCAGPFLDIGAPAAYAEAADFFARLRASASPVSMSQAA